MKYLADENVDRPIVVALRKAGFEVEYVAEDSPGIVDIEVLKRAQETAAVLLTGDKDFGELVFRQRAQPWCSFVQIGGAYSGREDCARSRPSEAIL